VDAALGKNWYKNQKAVPFVGHENWGIESPLGQDRTKVYPTQGTNAGVALHGTWNAKSGAGEKCTVGGKNMEEK